MSVVKSSDSTESFLNFHSSASVNANSSVITWFNINDIKYCLPFSPQQIYIYTKRAPSAQKKKKISLLSSRPLISALAISICCKTFWPFIKLQISWWLVAWKFFIHKGLRDSRKEGKVKRGVRLKEIHRTHISCCVCVHRNARVCVRARVHVCVCVWVRSQAEPSKHWIWMRRPQSPINPMFLLQLDSTRDPN